MPWLGKKKLALVPLYRPNFRFPPDQIPDDWPGLIMQRLFYEPDQSGVDRSLRAYIHTTIIRACGFRCCSAADAEFRRKPGRCWRRRP